MRSCLHRLAPAGQHLVAVGLVADVPDQAVVRRVEHVMQRDRELDRAEVGREMAAGLAHRFDAGTARSSLARAGCSSRARRQLAADLAGSRIDSMQFVARLRVRSSELAQHDEIRRAARSRQRARAEAVPAPAARPARSSAASACASATPSALDVGRLVAVARPCRRSCPASPSAPRRRARRRPPGTRDRWTWRSGRRARAPRRPERSPQRAPSTAAARISAPVLWMCMNSSSGTVSLLPTASRSIAWPPAMPREPAAAASSLHHLELDRRVVGERVPAAAGKRGFAARRRPAAPSPRRTRRGRSACRAAARRRPCTADRRAPANRRGSARPPRPPRPRAPIGACDSSPAANASSGRTRLPPPSTA